MSKLNYKSRVILGLLSLALAFVPSLAWLASSVFSAGPEGHTAPRKEGTRVEGGPTPFPASIAPVQIFANNVVYVPGTQKMYASVPSGMGSKGNSIATIDPAAGVVESTVFIGSEPNKLALAGDNRSLYVVLDGARQVRKFDIRSNTVGAQFSAGISAAYGPWNIIDLAVSPNDPNQVAIARRSASVNAAGKNSIFDSGVPRPSALGESNSVIYSPDSSKLFGANQNGEFEVMTVDASGVSTLTETSIDGQGITIEHIEADNGLIYTSRGTVVDPATGSIAGTFDIGPTNNPNSKFVVDGEHSRIFFLVPNIELGTQIRAFDLNTRQLIGRIDIPLIGALTDIKRWGTNGLAVSHMNAPLLLIRSGLVNPNEPVPPAFPTPFPPTPTPMPTPWPATVRRIDQLANDLVVHPAEGNLYVSVPPQGTNGTANTITRISLATGAIVSSTSVGSEPTKLGMADDGHSLYVSVNGARDVRRFDTTTQTPGLQFTVSGSFHPTYATDLKPVPGSPDSVAVSVGGRVALYDNGVRRPLLPTDWQGTHNVPVGPLEFTGPNRLYGYDNLNFASSFFKLDVVPDGLLTAGTIGYLVNSAPTGDAMTSAEGKIYTSNGRVIDPDASLLTGTFPYVNGNTIEVDTVSRRAFVDIGAGIRVFDIDTYLWLGDIRLPSFNGGYVSTMARWGTDGLALRIYQGPGAGYILLVQSPLISAAPQRRAPFDFDGDGKSDVSLFRPSEGNWFIQRSTDGFLGFHFGAASDKIAPADYDGDGKTDFGVYRPSDGTWYIQNSTTGFTAANFGTAEDIPQPGDFNGDGKAEIALYRPSEGNWYTMDLVTGQTTGFHFGTSGDKPVAGDYDGDGKMDYAVYRPSEGNWYLMKSTEGFGAFHFGVSEDMPVPADYDGDGKTDFGVFRPSEGNWYLMKSTEGFTAFHWGLSTDLPVPADYDGDGKTDIAVFRDGQWYLQQSANGYTVVNFGLAGDKPAPNSFVY